GTSAQNTAALHRQGRRGVGCGPCFSTIERMRDVKMPDAVKASIVGSDPRAFRRYRSVERNSRAVAVACSRGGEANVLDPINRSNVEHIFPGTAQVVGYRDAGAGARAA